MMNDDDEAIYKIKKKQVFMQESLHGSYLCTLTFVSAVGNGHGHIFTAVVVLRFGWRGSEAADARLGRRAERRHAVRRVVGTCGHLVGRAVGDETLGDGELGVLKVLLQLGVLVGPGQLLIGGGGALRRHHAVATLIWKKKKWIGQIRAHTCHMDQHLTLASRWFPFSK